MKSPSMTKPCPGTALLLGALALLGAVRSAEAGLARQVKDINPGTRTDRWGGVCGSQQGGPVFDEYPIFFFADRSGSGCELFAVTAFGSPPSRIADLGESGAALWQFLGRSADNTYFVASSALRGAELWRTDGTQSGTIRLSFFSHTPYRSYAKVPWFTPTPGGALFGAWSEGSGIELWKSDGTPAGTQQVMEIRPGAADGVIGSRGVVHGSFVYFVADDGLSGQEVWRSDGTNVGTTPLTALPVPSNNDSRIDLASIGNQILFAVQGPGSSTALWTTDGTIGGTTVVRSFAPTKAWSQYPAFESVGDRAFFSIERPDDSKELWTSDGIAASTTQVAAWASAASSEIRGFHPVGGRWVFVAYEATHGLEPWITDGTIAGTQLLSDVRPGPSGSVVSHGPIAALDQQVLLVLDDGVHGPDLWRTDGTAPGTRIVYDFPDLPESLGPSLVGAVGDTALFEARGPAGPDQLFGTDGTEGGTVQITSFGGTISSSFPSTLTDTGALLYFTASAAEFSSRPWRTDGTEAETFPLVDDLPDSGWTGYFDLGNGTVIGSSDLVESSLLWSTTGEEIVPLLEVTYSCGPHNSCGLLGGLGVAGGVALFPWWSELSGAEPWKLDGTVAGTEMLADLVSGPESSSARRFIEVGDEVWFTALDPTDGEGVWRSAGTFQSTERFADLGSSASLRRVQQIWPVDREAGSFFFERSQFDGNELWFHAGGTEEPELLRVGIKPTLRSLGIVNGRMLFALEEYKDPGLGEELWATDGTAAGTRLVRDLWPGPTGSLPADGIELDGAVLFRACEPVGGCELWTTDGTTAATVRLLDLVPGLGSSYPTGLSRIGERVYFSACRIATGCEPWITDGSAAGTHAVREIAPGPYSSLDFEVPAQGGSQPKFVLSGSEVFLAADDGTGAELWAMPIEIFYDGFETGDTQCWAPFGLEQDWVIEGDELPR